MKAAIKSKYIEEFEKYGRLNSISIIDTHTHMDDVYGTCLDVCSMEDCIKAMEEENIKQIWCAPHGDLFYPLSPNNDIEKYMSLFPQKVKGYYSFNPNYYDIYSKGLDRILSNIGYIGIKILPEYHKYPIDGENYKQAFEIANDNHLILLCHTWGGSPFNSIRHIEIIAEKYSNIQIILGHSAPNECDRAIELCKYYKNVYLDLCDIHRHSGIVEKMVKTAGSDKVLFGTDLPWYDPNYCTGSILYANITDEDRENIFYKNAERMLNNINKRE